MTAIETTPPDAGEHHFINRTGWLRAAVLGANDGLLSTASLLVGVAAAQVTAEQLLVTAVAGIAAGAMAMAAGEYVSVSSQADSERADVERERLALAQTPHDEERELCELYVDRGLEPALARQVAAALHAHDALGAHVRDELGITETSSANPLQAALASGVSFTLGGLPPLAAVLIAPHAGVIPALVAVTVATLAMLGGLGARMGGAPLVPGIARVTIMGSLAMAVTAGVGHLFHLSGG
jgi:vacuolar iron transporter family protein